MTVVGFEPNVFGVDKPAGWTPLQALDELRSLRPELKDAPLTYAGRLDPMAEGLLLVLANGNVHEKDAFLGLDKWYTVTALFGVTTDSYDLLGMPQKGVGALDLDSGSEAGMTAKIKETLSSYVGQTTLPLPPYSSPPYHGKPLFWWAHKGLAVDAPKRTTNIYNIAFQKLFSTAPEELLQYINQTVPSVHGDFRQKDIITAWNVLLANTQRQIVTANFTVHCSSGTYIRSLTSELGKSLGTGACVYTLKRTNVGRYKL